MIIKNSCQTICIFNCFLKVANNSVKFWALFYSDVEEWCIYKVQMYLSRVKQ